MRNYRERLVPNSALSNILTTLMQQWPEHDAFLRKSFDSRSGADWEDAELLADLISQIENHKTHDLNASYRWLCDVLLEEEKYFRRFDRYQRETLQQVRENIYDNSEFMAKYIKGLLASQLFFSNHAKAFSFLRRRFFPMIQNKAGGFRHLEIGPGHGLLLYLAAESGQAKELWGWDISPTSLAQTRESIAKLGVTAPVYLEQADASSAKNFPVSFDSIVLSEVLEHTENPGEILGSLKPVLAPGGKIFINFPVNSPAPDHLYLLRTIEQVEDLVKEQGFQIEVSEEVPMTGKTLDQARKHRATINCLLVLCARSLCFALTDLSGVLLDFGKILAIA